MNIVRLIFLLAVIVAVMFYGYIIWLATGTDPINDTVVTVFGIISGALATNLGIVLGIRISNGNDGGTERNAFKRVINTKSFTKLPTDEKLAEIAGLLYFIGLLVIGFLWLSNPDTAHEIITTQALTFVGVLGGIIANLRTK